MLVQPTATRQFGFDEAEFFEDAAVEVEYRPTTFSMAVSQPADDVTIAFETGEIS
jgi:hypothetical protein